MMQCLQENLFTDGGLKQEINDIRELLDTGGGKLWDNKGGLSILEYFVCPYFLM